MAALGVPPAVGGLGALGTLELVVVNCPNQDLAKTNLAFVAPGELSSTIQHLQLGDYVFAVRPDVTIPPGSIGLNAIQRKVVRVSSGDRVSARPFDPPQHSFHIVDFISKKLARGPDVELDAPELTAHLQARAGAPHCAGSRGRHGYDPPWALSRFGGQVLTLGQELTFEFQGTNYLLRVNNIMVLDSKGEQLSVHQGQLIPDTGVVFEAKHGGGIKIAGQKAVIATQLFKHKEFNFERLGIGGLDLQFEQIFRRAFASRVFPPSVVERLGIRHVRGVLLFGPPGTGKTLIARQIGKMLNGKEPKVVNGPEVLNKYVGASEENIRNLFKEAEADYAKLGEASRGECAGASELHVIIFDEIDAICKQRGSVQSGAGVHDTIVNQLLTKIDGVDALNNILLIGMTNRKDLLDEALLRPGRLEVQVEIGLPDKAGRAQILAIHTSRMSQNSFLGRDVDLAELAERTKNFSGAEIEGLVKSATSFALNRQVDVSDLSKPIDEESIQVTMSDFLAALGEIKPAFGAVVETLEAFRLHGMTDYGPRYQHLLSSCRTLVQQVRVSETTPLVTCLLEGPPGSGKTALAASIAIESGFPFVISAESMVGFSEAAKCQQISRVFDDAYRSPFSFIVLDDIERLLEYVAIGPRFSNAVLQTLLVLLKKLPPPGRKLFVMGTTSLGIVMQEMDVAQTFNVVLPVARLSRPEIKSVLQQARGQGGKPAPLARATVMDAFAPPDLDTAVAELEDTVPVKRLLLLLDLARQGQEEAEVVPLSRWAIVTQDLA
eukprot:scaffold6.g2765.t1